MMDAKIRVVENIGEWSEEQFGKTGTIHCVIDGMFCDRTGFDWTNDGKLFNSFDDIYKYFSDIGKVQTIFELVEQEAQKMSDLISREESINAISLIEKELNKDKKIAINCDDERMIFAIDNQLIVLNRVRCRLNSQKRWYK